MSLTAPRDVVAKAKKKKAWRQLFSNNCAFMTSDVNYEFRLYAVLPKTLSSLKKRARP